MLCPHFLTDPDYFRKDLIVFKNFFIYRSSDLFTVFVLAYNVILSLTDFAGVFYVVYDCPNSLNYTNNDLTSDTRFCGDFSMSSSWDGFSTSRASLTILLRNSSPLA